MKSCTNKRERALLKERDSGTLCKHVRQIKTL
jgi:hypothetical protein